MGVYDPGQLYVDPILTNLSVGFADQELFGLRLFPETPVNTQSGRYRVFDRSDWLIHRSRREPLTVANEVGARKWSEDNFKTQEHSLQSAIADEERQELHSMGGLANPVFGGDLQIDPEADAVKYITRSILLEHELKVSGVIRDTANYPAGHKLTLVGTTQWSDYTFGTPGIVESVVSNPVADLRLACRRIYDACGRWPNTMTIPLDAVGVIENHPRVVARYTFTSVYDPEAWRLILGLPAGVASGLNVIVTTSKYNQADNIDMPEDIVDFWGDDVWLGIVDATPGQKTHTFGKTFAQLYPNGVTRPSDRWREEDRKADLVRTSYKYDFKIVSAIAGYLFTDAVSPV